MSAPDGNLRSVLTSGRLAHPQPIKVCLHTKAQLFSGGHKNLAAPSRCMRVIAAAGAVAILVEQEVLEAPKHNQHPMA